jgi:alkyl sulfatase BDS1-like metallo-beta-lactamase superfamily hydrolase
MAMALTVEQVLDSIASRVDGPKAWDERLSLDLHVTDVGEHHRAELSNGVLIHYTDPDDQADLTLTLTKPQLLGLLAGGGLDGVEYRGDTSVLTRLVAVLVTYDRSFPIRTP